MTKENSRSEKKKKKRNPKNMRLHFLFLSEKKKNKFFSLAPPTLMNIRTFNLEDTNEIKLKYQLLFVINFLVQGRLVRINKSIKLQLRNKTNNKIRK